MVVGEAEIGGQVARAFRDAQLAGTASPAINLLFQSAARTAKQVTTDTGLGAAGRSIASVALDIVARSGRARRCAGPGDRHRRLRQGGRRRAADPRAAPTCRCSRPAAGPPGSPTGTGRRRSHADGLVDAVTAADIVITCSGRASDVLDEQLLATRRRRTRQAVADHRSRAALGRFRRPPERFPEFG